MCDRYVIKVPTYHMISYDPYPVGEIPNMAPSITAAVANPPHRHTFWSVKSPPKLRDGG